MELLSEIRICSRALQASWQLGGCMCCGPNAGHGQRPDRLHAIAVYRKPRELFAEHDEEAVRRPLALPLLLAPRGVHSSSSGAYHRIAAVNCSD